MWSRIARFLVLREAALPFVGRRGHTVHCVEARPQAVLRLRAACQLGHERVTAGCDGLDRIYVVFPVPRARGTTSWNGASPARSLVLGTECLTGAASKIRQTDSPKGLTQRRF
jgi:hypothetical protein